MDLWIVFITGLTVGGLNCLAVQGGLLTSAIAAREEDDLEKGNKRNHTAWPTLAFLASKFIAYTILGFILGAFGGALNISPNMQIIMQFIAGLYMLAIALNLLNVHPIFRYAIIQPPRFLTRMVRSQSKSKDIFAPALLGAMTVFIPCGTTLAMETLAISSASPILGASIMAAFVLGTTPLFFGIGWLTSVLGDNFREKFLKLAAIAVFYLGITSINGSLVASGFPITFQAIAENFPIQINLSGNTNKAIASNSDSPVKIINGVQVVDISVLPNGYNPSLIQVKVGQPVKLNLNLTGALGCTSVFRMPQLGVIKNLTQNADNSVEFTSPERGKYVFACSMGMYQGIIEVI